MSINNGLKAYVRYDGTGRIVPGGPIFSHTKPKNGDWVEVDSLDCCITTSTTSTSTTTSAPYYTFILFADDDLEAACGGTPLQDWFSNSPTLEIGTILYFDVHLTNPVSNSWYGDGQGNCWQVTGGSGEITNLYLCYYSKLIYFDNVSEYNAVNNSNQQDVIYSPTYDISIGTALFYDSNRTTLVNDGWYADVNASLVYHTTNGLVDSSNSWINALRLIFTNINQALNYVADPASVSDWNTFFGLPANGGPFDSVTVVGNEVDLYGGFNITMKDYLFNSGTGLQFLKIIDSSRVIAAMGANVMTYNISLIEASFPKCITITEDGSDYGLFGYCTSLASINMPSLVTAGYASFYTTACTNFNFPSLVTTGEFTFRQDNPVAVTVFNLPLLQTVGPNCFQQPSGNTTMSVIYIPSCINLGPTVGDNFVFDGIIGSTITLTVPAALMTCNGGLPDGDIQYLQANNTVTIVTV